MCPSDPQRAHHRQMQRHHLNFARLALLCPAHPFLAPCSAPVTSPLVTLSIRTGLLVQRSWLYPGFETCFSLRLHCVVLWLA